MSLSFDFIPRGAIAALLMLALLGLLYLGARRVLKFEPVGAFGAATFGVLLLQAVACPTLPGVVICAASGGMLVRHLLERRAAENVNAAVVMWLVSGATALALSVFGLLMLLEAAPLPLVHQVLGLVHTESWLRVADVACGVGALLVAAANAYQLVGPANMMGEVGAAQLV